MDVSNIERLIEVLEKESKLYDDILKLSKDKTGVIIKGKVTELEGMVRLEQSLIMQMRKLEDSREKLVESISGELGVDPGDLTLTQLVKLLDAARGKRLKACQDKMKGALDELKNCNELNSRLINNSLEYIDFSINLFSAAGNLNNGYGSTGQADSGKKRNFFDVKL